MTIKNIKRIFENMNTLKKHDLVLISQQNKSSQSQPKKYIDLNIPTFEELQKRRVERMKQANQENIERIDKNIKEIKKNIVKVQSRSCSIL